LNVPQGGSSDHGGHPAGDNGAPAHGRARLHATASRRPDRRRAPPVASATVVDARPCASGARCKYGPIPGSRVVRMLDGRARGRSRRARGPPVARLPSNAAAALRARQIGHTRAVVLCQRFSLRSRERDPAKVAASCTCEPASTAAPTGGDPVPACVARCVPPGPKSPAERLIGGADHAHADADCRSALRHEDRIHGSRNRP
jgi:hypothetical protein